MKIQLAVLVCIVGAALSCAPRKHAALDGWYDGSSGYELAMAEQQRTGKPVFVYFHTNWCGWCSKLERDVLTTGAFRNRYDSALKVRIDPEQSRANAEIASRYGVHGFPTMCVIADGEARQPIVGYLPPDDYIAALRTTVGD